MGFSINIFIWLEKKYVKIVFNNNFSFATVNATGLIQEPSRYYDSNNLVQKFSEVMQKQYSDEPAMLKKRHMPLHMERFMSLPFIL